MINNSLTNIKFSLTAKLIDLKYFCDVEINEKMYHLKQSKK